MDTSSPDSLRKGVPKKARPWRVVAEEVSREQDPKKMPGLITELNQALDEQIFEGTPKPRPDIKPEPDTKTLR